MSDYIQMWLDIIENMNNSNTYKLAWGRAILEVIRENRNTIITFDEISEKMMKYYWNQIFFFNLKQSPSINQTPEVVKYTTQLIHTYKEKTNSEIPVWFDRAYTILKEDKDYTKTINTISRILTYDVSWRFKKVNKKELDIYDLDIKNRTLTFTEAQIDELYDYCFLLSQLLNYRWAQLLEQFNNAPKIASKVKGISDSKLRRNSLTKFKNALLALYEDGKPIDFYTGDILEENDISVDHVIPWSFMYSDDIWNLVLTSKSNNSSKSNSVPSQETINKLKERNTNLVNIIDNTKYKEELNEAIMNNYVDKYYYSMKG